MDKTNIDETPPAPIGMLNELGNAEYKRISDALHNSGRHLHATDWAFVLEYAHSFQCYVQACQQATAKATLLAENEKGVEYNAPIHNIVSQYRTAMNQAAAKLGLAPADRKKVLGEIERPQKIENPLEKLRKVRER